jgi:hypothetical protein
MIAEAMSWPDATAFIVGMIVFCMYFATLVTGRYPWEKK